MAAACGVFGLTLLAACAHDAAAPSVTEDVADLVTPAMVLIENDGGNTSMQFAWRMDSATATGTFIGISKLPCELMPRPCGFLIARGVPVEAVDSLMRVAVAPDFRALHRFYPITVLIPDIGRNVITVVANGRRQVVSGEYPALAEAFAARVQSLMPGPPP